MGSLGTSFFSDFRSPLVTLPVRTFCGWLVGHAFPPDAAFGSESHVGKDRVGCQSGHRIRIGLRRSAWRHAEESCFRIDSMQTSFRIRLDPGNVVSNGPNFPAFETGGWNQHRKICFAAGAGKGCGDISLLALWIFDADDEH